MKQLVARAEAGPATRAVVGPVIGTVAGVVTGASYTAPQAEAEVAFWADGEAE